jgi:hypothetical protein
MKKIRITLQWGSIQLIRSKANDIRQERLSKDARAAVLSLEEQLPLNVTLPGHEIPEDRLCELNLSFTVDQVRKVASLFSNVAELSRPLIQSITN